MVSDSYGMRVPTESAIESSSRVRSDSETSRRATSDKARNEASVFSGERSSCTRAPWVPLVPGQAGTVPAGQEAPATYSALWARALAPGGVMLSGRGRLAAVDPITFVSRPALERPTLVTAFRGWNDAGESATAAATFLREHWNAELFAKIDPEEFFDFQVTRPMVRLVDGVSRVIEWPACEFHHARLEGRDVVVFVGAEPNVRWRTFATAIVDLARSLGSERLITLGA